MSKKKYGTLAKEGKPIGLFKESAFNVPIRKGKTNQVLQRKIDKLFKESKGGK